MSKCCVYYDADANRCDYHDPISFKLGAENRQLRRERDTLTHRIDELCAEVEALKRDEWAAGFNAGCDAVEAAYEDGRPYYEVENAKLQDENARLRSCLSDDAENARMIMAENAKLRELVQNLRRVTPADVVGVVIGANTDHPSYYKFDKAFRELGIEVD